MHGLTRSTVSFARNTSAHVDSVGSRMQDSPDFYRPKGPYSIGIQVFTDNDTKVQGLLLGVINADISTKKVLGLTASEVQSLKALLINFSLKQAKLFFKNENSEANRLVSPEGLVYHMYTLGIVAENNFGTLQVFYPAESVQVYTLDHYIFFSKAYSEFIPNPVQLQFPNHQIPEL